MIVSTPQEMALIDARRGVRRIMSIDDNGNVFPPAVSGSQTERAPPMVPESPPKMCPRAHASTCATFRQVDMYRKVGVDILGMIENMAWLEAPDGSRTHIFGEGGVRRTAEASGCELLGEVPLDMARPLHGSFPT